MFGQISHPVGQELAQIARQKRGPFQRPAATPSPGSDEDAGAIRGHAKSSAASRNHAAATVTKSQNRALLHNYNIKVSVPVATLIGDGESAKNEAPPVAPRLTKGHSAARASALPLQDVHLAEHQKDAPDARPANGQVNGWALGHDKDSNNKATQTGRPEQSHEPVSLGVPRPSEGGDPENFIKRFQHRDFNAEAALNLLSDGKEHARDASLSVKFKAYADSAMGDSKDQHFVQQFLNGAERA